MIQQRITYLQRSTETDEYGQRRCQHLHAETEKLVEMPTFAELRDRFKQFYTAETWVSFDNVSVTPIDLAKS